MPVFRSETPAFGKWGYTCTSSKIAQFHVDPSITLKSRLPAQIKQRVISDHLMWSKKPGVPSAPRPVGCSLMVSPRFCQPCLVCRCVFKGFVPSRNISPVEPWAPTTEVCLWCPPCSVCRGCVSRGNMLMLLLDLVHFWPSPKLKLSLLGSTLRNPQPGGASNIYSFWWNHFSD